MEQPRTRRERKALERAAEEAARRGSAAPGSAAGHEAPAVSSDQLNSATDWDDSSHQASAHGGARPPSGAAGAGPGSAATGGAPAAGNPASAPRPVIRPAVPTNYDPEATARMPWVDSSQAAAGGIPAAGGAGGAPQTGGVPRTGNTPSDWDRLWSDDMTAGAGGAGGSGRGRGGRAGRQREPLGPVRATVRGFGELCITAGLVLILFVVWQLWWTDIEANQDNAVLAQEITTEWRDNPANEVPDDPDEPVVAEPVDENSAFGIMYIPRFGDDYYRTIAEGVSLEPVLNRMGLGRYPTSAMPGEVGNFAMAGHRVTYGKPLNLIAELRPGDEIIVQTGDGYYTYTFRNFDIVLPDATEVLAAVPSQPDYKGKDRIMTLTACNPMFSARERYVAYAELSDWQPSGEGAPESIKDSDAYQTVAGDDQ